jgi:hypothetical protein
MEQSKDVNAADAVEYIETIENAEEVRAFVSEDEERKTVLAAAEKRIAELSGTGEPDPEPPAPDETEKLPTAKEDIWLYHEEHEPKLFTKGEEIPEGWQIKNQWKWIRNPKNNFHWEKPLPKRLIR